MTEEIEYFSFDSIQMDEDGQLMAYYGDKWCYVYHGEGATEEELIRDGWAKCDAPGTETLVVALSEFRIVDGEYELIGTELIEDEETTKKLKKQCENFRKNYLHKDNNK